MANYSREEIEQMTRSKVTIFSKDYYGNAILKKYTQDHIFCTNINKEDVEFFLQVFEEANSNDANYIWYKLKYGIENFINDNKRNPIEAFLYALKLKDNCFGSESSGGYPDEKKLYAFAKAAEYMYENSDKTVFFNVIKNVLTNWEWYQPLHVCIALFGTYPDFKDEEIDEILRVKMLYRLLYSKTTFEALLNRPSYKNYKALMDFIVTWNVTDIRNGTPFTVSKPMLDSFISTLHGLEGEEIFDELKEDYALKYMSKTNINKIPRDSLNNVFKIIGDIDASKWASMFSSFDTLTEDQKNKFLQTVRIKFRLRDKDARDSINQISNENIFTIVCEKLQLANDNDKSWALLNIAKNKKFFAKKYIREECKKHACIDTNSFPLFVSSYICDGKPTLNELCDFYFQGDSFYNEKLYAPLLKHAITYTKSKTEFLVIIESLVVQCMNDIYDKKKIVFSRASRFYGSGNFNSSIYPTQAMDGFIFNMMQEYIVHKDTAVINDILTILEKAIDNNTIKKYENLLIEICKIFNENTNQFRLAKDLLGRYTE